MSEEGLARRPKGKVNPLILFIIILFQKSSYFLTIIKLQKKISKLIINTIQVDDGSMPDNWLTSKTLCLLTDCNKEKNGSSSI